jgi:hypothetical protein
LKSTLLDLINEELAHARQGQNDDVGSADDDNDYEEAGSSPRRNNQRRLDIQAMSENDLVERLKGLISTLRRASKQDSHPM